jgi:hypothetical protein
MKFTSTDLMGRSSRAPRDVLRKTYYLSDVAGEFLMTDEGDFIELPWGCGSQGMRRWLLEADPELLGFGTLLEARAACTALRATGRHLKPFYLEAELLYLDGPRNLHASALNCYGAE